MSGKGKSIYNAAENADYDKLVPTNGKYPWPPVNRHTGKRMQSQRVTKLEAMLWYLRNEGGAIDHSSGLASRVLCDAINAAMPDVDVAISTMPTLIADALALGLIEEPVIRGRRTYRIALMPAVKKWTPGRDPFPQSATEAAVAEIVANEQQVAAAFVDDVPVHAQDDLRARENALLAAVEEREQAHDEANGEAVDSFLGAIASEHLSAEMLNRLAIMLLNEVVRRATTRPDDPSVSDAPSYVYVERNHYRDLEGKQRARIQTLEEELDRNAGRLKSLKLEVAEERRLREGVEANLAEVLKAVHAYQRRIGSMVDEDTKRALDNIMRTAPGFDRYREGTNGNGSNGHPTNGFAPKGPTRETVR